MHVITMEVDLPATLQRVAGVLIDVSDIHVNVSAETVTLTFSVLEDSDLDPDPEDTTSSGDDDPNDSSGEPAPELVEESWGSSTNSNSPQTADALVRSALQAEPDVWFDIDTLMDETELQRFEVRREVQRLVQAGTLQRRNGMYRCAPTVEAVPDPDDRTAKVLLSLEGQKRTIASIAQATGIHMDEVHAIIRDLHEADRITRVNDGWTVIHKNEGVA